LGQRLFYPPDVARILDFGFCDVEGYSERVINCSALIAKDPTLTAGMFSRVLLILLLTAIARAQGTAKAQETLVKGTVILNGEGGPGVANVQITDSAHTDLGPDGG
jgi:hypothetical protein